MGLLLNLVPWWGRALAIVAAFAAAAAFGALKMHAHDKVAYDELNLAYANFRADVKAQGDIAAKLAAEQDAKQKEVEDALRKDLAGADAAYADAVRRLRGRAPSRPDGSAVPVQACPAQGVGGSADQKSVPLADYRALEERAAYDAQTLELLKDWIRRLVEAGALLVQ